MIPATFTLLVAAASTNALPIFSGFFAPRAVAPAPAATVQRRDLNNTQFAQGTNFYFASLLLEAECTPGQVACIDGKTATCSAEANWEVSPCSEGTTCYAVPASTDPTNDAVVVKCMTQDEATTAFGSTNFSEDFQITAAPFNTTVTPDPSSDPSDSSTTDVPSGTETFSDEPTSTDSSLPDGTCTEDPEPTETETITVIAIPDASNSDSFIYSTVFPTETDVPTATETDIPTSTETATETATIVDVPTATSCAGTTYQPTELTTCDQVATLYGISSDDVYNNNNFVDCNNIWAYTVLCLPDGSSDPAPSDSSSDAPAPTDSSVSSTEDATPTTLSVPPASPSTPANVVPVPEVSIVDTHVIPASSSIVPPANLKMRKVRRF